MAAVVSACAPPRQVAVEERTTITRAEESERIGGQHIRIVQPGDTLYAIAFANGLDAKRLAAWNRKSDTAKLNVGERLRLTAPAGFVMPLADNKPRVVARTVPATPPTQQDPRNSRQARTRGATSTAAATPPTAPTTSPATAALDQPRWQWPTQGRVVKAFNVRSGQQGVDIAGSLGQPVIAAQPGEVVYVGNGLKGYGNLVILKHSNEFLSAYAHNLETFVQEGQLIKAKQRIATMGKIRGRDALHFQIRLNGEPVNPQRYLP